MTVVWRWYGDNDDDDQIYANSLKWSAAGEGTARRGWRPHVYKMYEKWMFPIECVNIWRPGCRHSMRVYTRAQSLTTVNQFPTRIFSRERAMSSYNPDTEYLALRSIWPSIACGARKQAPSINCSTWNYKSLQIVQNAYKKECWENGKTLIKSMFKPWLLPICFIVIYRWWLWFDRLFRT